MSATIALVAACVRAAAGLPDDAPVDPGPLGGAEMLRRLALAAKAEHNEFVRERKARSEHDAAIGALLDEIIGTLT